MTTWAECSDAISTNRGVYTNGRMVNPDRIIFVIGMIEVKETSKMRTGRGWVRCPRGARVNPLPFTLRLCSLGSVILHSHKTYTQLCSQSQSDGAQLAALSLQMQELISLIESRAKAVGKDLEEINGQFDRHRGEINHLKIREKDVKQETEKLKSFIVGAGHEAQVFKNHLDRMEENVCRCGRTPSEVGEEFVSSEDEGRTELSYASVREDEYVAPPIENSLPIPIPRLATSCCLGSVAAPLPPMEEITKEATFICDDLDGLLREADEERTRDLQEGPSNSVVHSPP